MQHDMPMAQTAQDVRAQDKAGYKSLFTILAVIVAAAAVASTGSLAVFIRALMAGYFLVFGMFKLLDLNGFAETFADYDLLAGQVKGYGYLYPFIELAVGLATLAGIHDGRLDVFVFVWMIFGALGVAISLRKMKGMRCACLGTVISLPLTTVSLIEDLSMAALAVVLFLMK